MFRFVKHLRRFVFQAVQASFGLSWTLILARCVPEVTPKRAALPHQAIKPCCLLIPEGRSTGDLPVEVHREFDVTEQSQHPGFA